MGRVVVLPLGGVACCSGTRMLCRSWWAWLVGWVSGKTPRCSGFLRRGPLEGVMQRIPENSEAFKKKRSQSRRTKVMQKVKYIWCLFSTIKNGFIYSLIIKYIRENRVYGETNRTNWRINLIIHQATDWFFSWFGLSSSTIKKFTFIRNKSISRSA